MDPFILSQVLNVIPSIFQGVVGLGQLSRAKRIERQYPRPEATILPSIEKMTGYTYGRTLAQDIPGGEFYRNQIKSATASGLRAASSLGSGSEAFGALGEIIGREQSAMSELARATARQIASYQSDYINTLGAKAQEEQRVWNWNEAQPYLMAQQIAQQLRQSGLKNIFSGAKNIFGSTAEYLNPNLTSSFLWDDGGYNNIEKPRYTDEDVKAILERLRGIMKHQIVENDE